MKKDGKYRYTLQFGSQSEEEIKAGELLERLGNKKSIVVVAALNDYIASHPDLENPCCKIEIRTEHGTPQGMEDIIRAIIEEKMKEYDIGNVREETPGAAELLEADVAQMLDNLDLFQ